MKKLLARWDILLILFILAAGNQLALVLLSDRLPGGGASIIHLQFAFTPSEFQSVVFAWGSEGIHQFLRLMVWDFTYPLFYSLFLASWLCFRAQRAHHRLAQLTFMLPFLAAGFDFLENIIHIWLAGALYFPSFWIFVASLAASFKWFCLLLCLLRGLKLKPQNAKQ